jgi:hypothetical protein
MSPEIWLLLFSALLLGSVLVFYFSPKYVPQITAAAAGPFKLNATTPIIKREQTALFTATDAGAFSAFVYFNPINRTASYSNNGFSGNGGSSSLQNGEYTICTCAGPSDCTECAHSGYNTVFTIGDILTLEVMVAPDASRQGKAMAQLVLKTQDSGNTYTETFIVPPLDVQKWTYITLSREGRRVDVYYNNEIVLSKKAQYNFAAIGSSITSGSPGLEGELILANVYNYRLSSKNVSDFYAQYADSRGQPYFNTPDSAMTLSDAGGLIPMYAGTMFSTGLSWIPSINLCPAGGCFSAPTVRPANPLYTWSTSYS